MTLAALLRVTAEVHGHRIALRTDAGTLDWKRFFVRIRRTASVLSDLGLAPGDRFGVVGRNSIMQAQLFYAGYWSGTVPVPLNFRLAAVELAELLDDAQCRVVLVDHGQLALFEHPALAAWHGRIVAIPPGGASELPGDPFEHRIESAAIADAHPSDEDDDALLLYTGGTTGRSKGVRLSHRNIVSNALQLSRVMAVGPDDVYLHVSPMFHSTDLKATVVTLFGGGHVYLGEFSADGVLAAVERHRVTILSLVPTMIVRVLQEGRLDRHDLGSLRLVSYGTSPIDESVLRQAMAAFAGVGFHQCYGLTETSPLLAVLDEAAHRRALDGEPALLRAAGRPLPMVEIQFRDAAGREVARGEAGEIVVRGPQVSRGYLHRNDENRAAFVDGWFRTGDIGRLDDHGYLHVLGRKKEIVITGGENVYPREVEQVLERHPEVREVAVVGVPDAQYGEALLGVIVPQQGPRRAPPADELIAFCREHLGGFKIPRRYLFVEALPRTALGKVRKHELVARYAASRGRI
ncbi:MAG: class I adenylate-forming enzyme family protein [Lautropia sp.]